MPAVLVRGAENQVHELGPSGSYQSGKAQDLPLMQIKVDVADAISAQVLYTEDNFLFCRLFLGICVGQFAADHEIDQFLLACILYVLRSDVLSVS